MTRVSLRTWTALSALLWVVGVVGRTMPASAQRSASAGLTAQDRAEIQQLVAKYARALSSCAAKEYAELFTPDGVFSSDDFRKPRHRELYGKSATLVGRAKLMELVETEDFCLSPDTPEARARTGANANRPPASHVIEATAEGAKGTVKQGNGGRVEDVYVKTREGWRFKSRSVFMPPLAAAQPASPAPSR